MKAILIEKPEDTQSVSLTDVNEMKLPAGDVLADVSY